MEQNVKGRLLYKFLRENRCLYQYIDEIFKSPEFRLRTKRMPNKQNLINFLNVHSDISSAFSWSSTKNGFVYWENLNYKFCIYYRLYTNKLKK